MVNNSHLLKKLDAVDLNNLLKEKGYSPEQVEALMENDILFLSLQNKMVDSKDSELVTLETVELKKILVSKLKDLKINFPLDTSKELLYDAKYSAEIIVGLLVFLGITAWELSKGIISNWLYDKFIAMKRESKSLNVQFEVQVIDDNGKSYHMKYSGPANEVSELIKKIKIK